MADGWEVLSQIIGWIYFLAWNFSFYPQSWEVYKIKDASGFSINFALLNITGFFLYSVYNTVGIVYPNVGTGTIEIQDMFFTYNAMMMSAQQLTQALIYPRGKQNVYLWNILLLSTIWGSVIITFFLQGVFNVAKFGKHFNTVMMTGYCKAVITFAYLNFKRKSTVGWNIYSIILDFIGGLFSLLQQLIDSLRTGSNQFFSGGGFNIVKFILSVCSIVFDVFFMYQHYVLYRNNRPKPGEKDRLINKEGKVEDNLDQYSGVSMKLASS